MRQKYITRSAFKMIKQNLFNYCMMLLIVTCLYTFLLGFHTSDTCQNMKYINSQLENKGIQFYETSIASSYIDAAICYKQGILMQIMSFFILMIITIFILFIYSINDIEIK